MSSEIFPLAGVRVVLLEPKGEANVGACARLCANFDTGPLYAVAPRCDVRGAEARRYAVGGALNRLEEIRLVPSLAEAVADCHHVLALNHKDGRVPAKEVAFDALGDWFAERLSGTRLALIVGREDNGISREEMLRIAHFCSIPTSSRQPALNMSHALAAALARIGAAGEAGRTDHGRDEPATWQEFEELLAHWRRTMTDTGLSVGDDPDRLLKKLRRPLQRAELTASEVALFRVFLSGLQTTLKKNRFVPEK